MKKYIPLVLTVVVLLAGLTACNSSKNNDTDLASTDESPKIDITNMAAEEIVNAFKDAGFPIDNVLVYDEETDPNALLGRPNQYISKVNFADTRIEQWDDEENPVGGSVEVFENTADAEARYEYINALSSSSSMFVQYLYLYKNVFLRIDKDLTPDQAAAYESGFEALQSGELPVFSE